MPTAGRSNAHKSKAVKSVTEKGRFASAVSPSPMSMSPGALTSSQAASTANGDGFVATSNARLVRNVLRKVWNAQDTTASYDGSTAWQQGAISRAGPCPPGYLIRAPHRLPSPSLEEHRRAHIGMNRRESISLRLPRWMPWHQIRASWNIISEILQALWCG